MMPLGPHGVPMEKVLSPDQCDEMRKFLRTLIVAQDKRPSKKLDLTDFMRQWREEFGQYWCGSHNGRKVING